MMNPINTRVRAILSLVVLAGGCAPLLAQDASHITVPSKENVPARDNNTTTATTDGRTPDLRSCHWLSDRDVVNDNGEDVAKSKDFIVDRGSGRIQFAILRTGTVLGLGGKTVVMPYSALRWDAPKQRYVLASTPEQLKALPEFDEDTWTAIMDPSSGKKESGDLVKRLTEHGAASQDPYIDALDTAKPVHIEGEILSVERVDNGRFGEQVEVTVSTKDGPRRVALGPAWYVNGAGPAPMRGDKVSIDGMTITRDTPRMVAANRFSRDTRTITLRESDGSPSWGLRSLKSDGKEYTSSRWRYVLLSDLRGAKIHCRGGNECGKVADIIIDRRSGQAAFLSIDPNQNFLGIADSKRLAPWSIATVTLGSGIELDASKEMVLASPQTPSDIGTLNSGETSDMVYRAYQTTRANYETTRTSDATTTPAMNSDDAWKTKGAICSSIDHASKRTLTGTIVGTKEEKFSNGVPSAHMMNVNSGQDAYLIVLGPSWYMDNQKLTCRDGDTVTIEAYRGKIDGKEYWIASSLECKGSKVVLLDSGRTPAWDRK